MSALHPKADIAEPDRDVRFVITRCLRDISRQAVNRGDYMTVKISGVSWTEIAKVNRRGSAVILEVMTKAGRFYRSTSFRLTKKEAFMLASELQKAASSN